MTGYTGYRGICRSYVIKKGQEITEGDIIFFKGETYIVMSADTNDMGVLNLTTHELTRIGYRKPNLELYDFTVANSIQLERIK